MNENQKKVNNNYRVNWDSIFGGTKNIEPIPFAGLVDIDEPQNELTVSIHKNGIITTTKVKA
jgi:hypothetical protein